MPLFILSKCSLAFIRNVAIELVRISDGVLMLILRAPSLAALPVFVPPA